MARSKDQSNQARAFAQSSPSTDRSALSPWLLALALLNPVACSSDSHEARATAGGTGLGGDSSVGEAGSGAGTPELEAGVGGAVSSSDPEASAAGKESGVLLETVPVAVQVTDEDDSAIMALSGFDSAGLVPREDLLAVVETAPENGALVPTRGPIPLATEYKPRPNFTGTDRFTFVVRDSDGNSSKPREVLIEVRPVNDPPLARDDIATTDSVTPIVIDVTKNDLDVDDTQLVVTSVTQPISGSVAIGADNLVVFSPRHPDSGRVAFEYTVRDASGATDMARVEVDVVETNVVRIASFRADKKQIVAGDGVTLTWSTAYANTCALDEGADAGGKTNGATTVKPTHSVRYTLTCQGPGGPAVASVVLVVLGAETADSDDDGIANAIEELTGTSATDSDSDDDGVPDGLEDKNANGAVDEGETDPRKPDSDGDGFCDGLRKDNDKDGIAPASACLGPVLVDVGNAGAVRDGRSWATAFSDLQAGVDSAWAGQSVWVKVGRYRATVANATVLTLRTGSAVYGGFSGNETYLEARDARSRATILDGDVLGDDTATPVIDASNPKGNPASKRADNSHHVVYGAEAARLDGFSVEHGHAPAEGIFQGGGGLLSLYPRLTIANTRFTGNSTPGSGGAILCADRCDLSVETCRFEDNRAANGGAIAASPTLTQGPRFLRLSTTDFVSNWVLHYGGAIDIRGAVAVFGHHVSCSTNTSTYGGCWFSQDSRVEFEDTEAFRNTAYDGGAIHSTRTSLVLRRVRLDSNSAGRNGGGLINNLGNATLTDTDLSRNSAIQGGAIASYSAALSIERSSIAKNVASEWGGGLFSDHSSTTLSAVSVSTNGAKTGGGASLHESSMLKALDTVFSANSATVNGGALNVQSDSKAELERAALVGNRATNYGAGIYAWRATYALTRTAFDANGTGIAGGGVAGGGVYQFSDVTGTMNRVVFVNNQANYGAGVLVFGPGSLKANQIAFVANKALGGAGLQVDGLSKPDTLKVDVRDSVFWKNAASNLGAGFFALNSTKTTIASSTFGANVSTNSGGAVFAQVAQPVLTNVTFLSNSARQGGAVSSISGSQPWLNQSTFFENSADSGGAIHNSVDSTATLRNSVAWASSSTGANIVDLGVASLTEYVASKQALSGAGNSVLTQNPFELGQGGFQLFLKQDLLTPPSALNAGLDSFAADPLTGFGALGLGLWSSMTTAADGRLDQATVDLGRHYSPIVTVVESFAAQGATLSWKSRNADDCAIFSDADATFAIVPSDQVGSGSLVHTHASGTLLTLICFGPVGEPALAFAKVP